MVEKKHAANQKGRKTEMEFLVAERFLVKRIEYNNPPDSYFPPHVVYYKIEDIYLKTIATCSEKNYDSVISGLQRCLNNQEYDQRKFKEAKVKESIEAIFADEESMARSKNEILTLLDAKRLNSKIKLLVKQHAVNLTLQDIKSANRYSRCY